MKPPRFEDILFRAGILTLIIFGWIVMVPLVFFDFFSQLDLTQILLDNIGANIYQVETAVFWIGLMSLFGFGFLWLVGVFD